jgi:phytoene dehydrogenase-like protein
VGAQTDETKFDAVIIGAGLGGLSCAYAFARQGFKPLVLEKQDKPGGYATTFKRPGGFVFDVSLHSTTVGEREGIHNLIPGFPEIKDVEFVPHPNLYRAIYPDYDIRVPQKNLQGYIDTLIGYFPDEKEGIEGIFEDMKGVAQDIEKFSNVQGQVDMSKFPMDFPYLFKSSMQTWGQMVDARIKNPKTKALVSSLWGYYGLPPSKLASIYYALPTIGYLQEGGYYPKGRSQKISDALVSFIQEHGGKVMLNTKAEEILVKDHSAYGVRTADNKEYVGKVVVSNANAYDTFHTMMKEEEYLKEYLANSASASLVSRYFWD